MVSPFDVNDFYFLEVFQNEFIGLPALLVHQSSQMQPDGDCAYNKNHVRTFWYYQMQSG
jgi:hypothetical protein